MCWNFSCFRSLTFLNHQCSEIQPLNIQFLKKHISNSQKWNNGCSQRNNDGFQLSNNNGDHNHIGDICIFSLLPFLKLFILLLRIKKKKKDFRPSCKFSSKKLEKTLSRKRIGSEKNSFFQVRILRWHLNGLIWLYKTF